MKIGITGCTGGLGRRLTELLLKKGYSVKALVRKKSNIKGLSKKIKFVFGDICNFNSLIDLTKNIDVCFHLAAQINYTAKNEYFEINIKGTDNLCKAILQYNPKCRLIYCSTISTLKVNPFLKFLSSNYGLSKYYAEKKVLEHIKKNNLNATIIYPGLIYGRYDKSFLHPLINAIKKGNIKLIKGGENKAPLIYVDELCELLIKSAINKIAVGKRYISVKGLNLGIHEIIKIIAKKINYKVSEKIYPKIPFFILAFILELFYRIFMKNKKPVFTRTAVDVLSINFKDYKKRYDDPKTDLGWEQNTSKEFFLKKIDTLFKN